MDPARPIPPDHLERLVEQLLLAETLDLGGPETAAFLKGWTALLTLVRRTDLTVPEAAPEVVYAIVRLVDAIERAQRAVTRDPDV